jgi:hypothetical protein
VVRIKTYKNNLETKERFWKKFVGNELISVLKHHIKKTYEAVKPKLEAFLFSALDGG